MPVSGVIIIIDGVIVIVHGTKANTAKGWSQTSWTTRSWLEGQFEQKVVTRVSQTTGNHGRKAIVRQKMVARVSQTMVIMAQRPFWAKGRSRMGIPDHQLWHEGHFGQKVGHARDQTTGHHRGTKANMGKGWLQVQDIADHQSSWAKGRKQNHKIKIADH